MLTDASVNIDDEDLPQGDPYIEYLRECLEHFEFCSQYRASPIYLAIEEGNFRLGYLAWSRSVRASNSRFTFEANHPMVTERFLAILD